MLVSDPNSPNLPDQVLMATGMGPIISPDYPIRTVCHDGT